MSQLQHARSFKDLIVYHKARATAKRIFGVSKRFPKEEMYSLTDQGRRSSRSVGAQIAEAWAKRCYERHFVSKLTDADGEQQETQHRTEEHTSELQSLRHLVCRLLLEKKKKKKPTTQRTTSIHAKITQPFTYS